jgi:hypothetical protein
MIRNHLNFKETICRPFQSHETIPLRTRNFFKPPLLDPKLIPHILIYHPYSQYCPLKYSTYIELQASSSKT